MTTENKELPVLDFSKAFKPDLSNWVRWEQGGFDLKLKYLSAVETEKLVKACEKTEWDAKTHQRITVMNDQRLKSKVAELILDWKGLTLEVAKKFISIAPGTPAGEFPCDEASKLFVIEYFSGFVSFIFDACKNLHQEAQNQIESEIKN